ncbi:MAG: sulfotransferase [Desulfobacteraceae bacterium]|nr:sulfotransferase [Desulfobacteraceae bacterium]
MILLTAIASICTFLFTVWYLGVTRICRTALELVQNSFTIINNPDLDNDTREKRIQQNSIKLFKTFFSILVRSGLAAFLSFLPIWLAASAGWLEIEDVVKFLSRWDIMLSGSFFAVIIYMLSRRLKPFSNKDFQINYSGLDRMVHRIAFCNFSLQLTAADIEKAALRKQYQTEIADRPIFITSLPRAGTTLLLEALNRLPSIATHTYRDMPFVMSPILWSKISRPFKKNEKKTERAHGDGMAIGYDSPEAFEEILWRAFWPEKYGATGIDLWEEDDFTEEAQLFFLDHMKKIIALRKTESNNGCRYLSKNNGNIARLDLIHQMFPKAKILVPIRHPLEQAASLVAQHRHFMDLHERYPFVRQYMADIGHYEFGKLHKPILFPEFEEFAANQNPLTIDYWLSYWIAAFEYIFERRDLVTILPYEATCLDGEKTFSRICAELEIKEDGMMEAAVSAIHHPSKKYITDNVDNKLNDRAEKLYKSLVM